MKEAVFYTKSEQDKKQTSLILACYFDMNIKPLIERLRHRLQQELPGAQSHLKMIPEHRRIPQQEISRYITPRISSIMILLYPSPHNHFFNTVLIKRTESNGVHGGQISFPGGRQDESDTSLEQTALRETFEEIGIEPKHIEILGSLSKLYVGPSNYEIYPFVGFVEKLPNLQPNPSEVEHLIYLPLLDLNSSRSKVDIMVRELLLRDIICFHVNGHIIWGATAMILQELLDILGGTETNVLE